MYKELFNLPCSKSSFDQVNGLLLFEIFTCFVLHMMAFQRSWQPFVTLPIGIWWKRLLDAVALWHPWTVGSSGAAFECSFERFHFHNFPQFWQKFSITQSVKNVPKLWQIYTYVRYIQSDRGHLPVWIAHCKNQFCLGHLAANAQIWVFTMRILSNMRKVNAQIWT